MQELPIIADAELRSGLSPRRKGVGRVNSVFMVDCEGLRSGSYGLEPAPLFTDPFNKLVPISWPFPNLFNGEADTLLFDKTAVKRVTKASGQWTLTTLTTYNTTSPASTLAIPAGGVWQFVDLGDAWYAFNGSCTVFKTGLETLKGGSEKIWCDTSVTIGTGCHHKSRVVIGGLSSSDVFSGPIINLAMKQMQASIKGDMSTTFNNIGGNYILWSSIGGGDFPLWLVMPLNTPAEYAPTADRIVDSMKRGEWGFSRCTFQGDVITIKPLGNHVVAYGADGVTAFTFTPGGGDIPPTYGRRHLLSTGLYDRGSVTEGSNYHLFVDKSGAVWKVSENLEVIRLDYSEYFSPATSGSETFVPSYDPHLDDAYLCTENRGFIYNNAGGLTKTLYRYPFIVQHNGVIYAAEKGQGNLTGKYSTFTLSAIDARRRELRTVTGVNVGYGEGGDVEVAIEYKYNANDVWARTDWVPVNKEGNAMIRVTALEHRILVRANDPTTFNVEHVTIKVQYGDRRFRRGPVEGSRIGRNAS